MWHVTAEEDMKCSECRHVIPSGFICLSQMPVDMPENFRRAKYENFCISCRECNRKAAKDQQIINPCYARALNHWYTAKKKTQQPTACAHCNQGIPEDAWGIVQKIYVWPESDTDTNTDTKAESTTGQATGITTTMVDRAAKSGAGNWHNLSPEAQRMFQTRGLGRNLGSRTPTMAKRLYETVPQVVRDEGEGAVLQWLKPKHFSHIKSVANAPSQAKQPSNILFEDASKNMARGSRNMTASEVTATKGAMRSSAIKTGMKSVTKTALVAALIEAPIASTENYLHYKRGRKSGGQAVKDTTKSTAVAGGTAVVVSGTAAGAVKVAALASVSLSLGPFGVPIAIGSGALLVGATIHRIAKANKRDIPLDEYFLFFCKKGNCKTMFAHNLASSL